VLRFFDWYAVEYFDEFARKLNFRFIGHIKTVTAEEAKEVTALLGKCVALLNETITASPERQVEIRSEYDRIMSEIDKVRRRYLN
jgi:hypothetical protein